MSSWTAAIVALSAYRNRRGQRLALDVAPVLAAYVAFEAIPIERQRKSTFFAALFVAKLLRMRAGRSGRMLFSVEGENYDSDDTMVMNQDNMMTAVARDWMWPAAAAALLPASVQQEIHSWGNLIT